MKVLTVGTYAPIITPQEGKNPMSYNPGELARTSINLAISIAQHTDSGTRTVEEATHDILKSADSIFQYLKEPNRTKDKTQL